MAVVQHPLSAQNRSSRLQRMLHAELPRCARSMLAGVHLEGARIGCGERFGSQVPQVVVGRRGPEEAHPAGSCPRTAEARPRDGVHGGQRSVIAYPRTLLLAFNPNDVVKPMVS